MTNPTSTIAVRPIRVLGNWALGLIAATLALTFLVTITDAIALADFENQWARPQVRGDDLQEWQSNVALAGMQWLALLAAAIVFTAWLWRARRNAEALCTARHHLPIGWVIGGWICPIVSFWFPAWILTDVVRASDPRTPPDTADLSQRPVDGLVIGWWLMFMLTWVLAIVAAPLSAPELRSQTTDEYFMYASAPRGGWGLIAVEFLQDVALAGAAACLAAVVLRVGRWQQERAAA
ncbi:DUF4328 domain-containing protein [Nocardia sp. NPDC127579]|uniref:DUF4328 domain-containing protein n=1 Tax=Nocardia sp. NPDC127579 TaxID=3345402 RepID=UPI003640AC78